MQRMMVMIIESHLIMHILFQLSFRVRCEKKKKHIYWKMIFSIQDNEKSLLFFFLLRSTLSLSTLLLVQEGQLAYLDGWTTHIQHCRDNL
jgi:hypothetical protein